MHSKKKKNYIFRCVKSYVKTWNTKAPLKSTRIHTYHYSKLIQLAPIIIEVECKSFHNRHIREYFVPTLMARALCSFLATTVLKMSERHWEWRERFSRLLFILQRLDIFSFLYSREAMSRLTKFWKFIE